ncbi:MAG: hypothetical protein ACK5HO_11685 [Pseudomonadota bacterium]
MSLSAPLVQGNSGPPHFSLSFILVVRNLLVSQIHVPLGAGSSSFNAVVHSQVPR